MFEVVFRSMTEHTWRDGRSDPAGALINASLQSFKRTSRSVADPACSVCSKAV